MTRPNWLTETLSWQVWQVFDIRPSDPMVVPCRDENGTLLSFNSPRDALSLLRQRSEAFPQGRYLLVSLTNGKVSGILLASDNLALGPASDDQTGD